MISEIKIDGFKSLQGFELVLHKGLNVLIGPNGAGKSNICQALGLIASSAEGRVSEYILSLGGGLTAFSTSSNVGENIARNREIKVSCKGETEGKKGSEKTILRYEYSFTIHVDKELSVTEETFLLFKKSKRNRFRLIMRVDRPTTEQANIEIKHPEEMGPPYLTVTEGKKKYTFTTAAPTAGLLPLLSVLYFPCQIAIQDMKFSRAWNIDPVLAKKSSDILEPSDMLPDGRRLANAIHAIQDSRDDLMDQINNFLSRILPGFSHIHLEHLEEGTRTLSVVNNRGIPCPANCLSDGTIKALALLIGVLSYPHSTTIIEEPENYLHPWACQLLIEFFREHFVDGVCLLTTHSETILNAIKPSEIIIIENIDGSTIGNRLSNTRDLTEVIRASGFGCGYHYLAGSLGGTPE